MKICPGCQRRYDDSVKFCPHDGTVLPDAEDEYVGARLMGQFDILDRCGEGAMGTVYRARQAHMDRDVAVKILRRDLVREPAVVKRFYREARAAARLSHPNIITVHLVAETEDGIPYIVMELLEGQDLDAICRIEAPVPVPRALHLAQQIAAALEEAHLHNVIHRDLKPANIIVVDRQRAADVVKVLDFGIAKILEAGTSDESRITKSGAIFGTPFYLSPEQATGGELDARADLYSLGVILYRLVTGHLPFEGGSGLDILVRHVKDAPPPPRQHVPDLPESLERIILRSLEKDRDARYGSAEEMRSELLALLSGDGVPEAIASGAWSRPASTPDRGRLADSSPGTPALGTGLGKDLGKKTVAGFGGTDAETSARAFAPVGPEDDPLVHAARRLMSSETPGSAPDPAQPDPARRRGGKPTVLGGAPSSWEGSGASSAARAEIEPRPEADPQPEVEVGQDDRNRAEGAEVMDPRDDDAPATDALPGERGRGASELSAPAPAPAPVPPVFAPAVVPTARSPLAPAPAPALSPRERAGVVRPRPLPAVASTPARPEEEVPASSPSLVSGQHVAPGTAELLAWGRGRDRGRWFLLSTVALAVVALGVGGYFVFRDRRERAAHRGDGSPAAAPHAPRDAGASSVASRGDAGAPRPAFSAGRELLRGVLKGVGVRASTEGVLRVGRPADVVVDLWRDGTGAGVSGAKVELVLGRGGMRPGRRFSARPTTVAGRYRAAVRFSRAGRVRVMIRVRLEGEAARSFSAHLSVTAPGRPSLHRRASHGAWHPPRHHAGGARPGGARPHGATSGSRPEGSGMTLPLPPPDDGPGGGGPSGLPRPPSDPPAPPPDPDEG